MICFFFFLMLRLAGTASSHEDERSCRWTREVFWARGTRTGTRSKADAGHYSQALELPKDSYSEVRARSRTTVNECPTPEGGLGLSQFLNIQKL